MHQCVLESLIVFCRRYSSSLPSQDKNSILFSHFPILHRLCGDDTDFLKKTRGFVKAGHHLDQQIGRQLRHSRKRTFEHSIDPRISTNYAVKSIFLKILIPISNRSGNCYLRICSCLACVYRVMDARGKFGEHEKCVRVTRGAAESNSSFLSALQTSQLHP